jgi:hypothetical protein
MNNKYHQGFYKPTNPDKYAGNPDNIFARSSWEKKVMHWFDNSPNVIYWASEEIVIPYFDPIKKRTRRYFPDFIVKIENINKIVTNYIIEVKPENQTKPPIKRKNTKTYITEQITYINNQCKWTAAEKYCAENNFKFVIITEKNLGLIYGNLT